MGMWAILRPDLRSPSRTSTPRSPGPQSDVVHSTSNQIQDTDQTFAVFMLPNVSICFSILLFSSSTHTHSRSE